MSGRCRVLRLAAATLLCGLLTGVDSKTVAGRTDVGHGPFEYLSKFCFGYGDGEVKFRVTESVIDAGYNLVLVMDEVWDEVYNEKSCERQVAQRDRGVITIELSSHTGLASSTPLTRDSTSFLRWSEWQSHSLTHSVRPHFWYVVLTNCHNSTKRQAPVHYDLQFFNEGQDHFSYDDSGMFFWTGLVFLFSTAIGCLVFMRLRRQYKRSARTFLGFFHPVIEALTIALSFHYVGMMFQLMHFWAFSSNGAGVPWIPAQFLATLSHEASRLTLTALFIVISQGYTIFSSKLPNRETLLPIVAATTGAELAGLLVQWVYADSHDAFTSRAREGVTGFILAAIHLTVYYWFLTGVKRCNSEARLGNSDKAGFFHAFSFCCSIWFLSEPLFIFISPVFAEYIRQSLFTGGSLVLQTIALCLLSRLFLWRSVYFKISTLSDTGLPGGQDAYTGARDFN